MNTPVKFELAKLLKEKGFDVPVLSCYFQKDEVSENYSIINQYEIEYIEDKGNFILIPYNENYRSLYLDKINFNGWGDLTFSAPTIAAVVMWLYEKHGIWVSVTLSSGLFWWEVMNNEKKFSPLGSNSYSSTEAYEAAIEYTLNNLI